MTERRKRMMKRLLFEELERRAMLNGEPIAMQSTGLTSNSYEDVYKAVVGTEIGGPGGVGMTGKQWVLAVNGPFDMPQTNSTIDVAGFPTADTGLGQITITTGANTLGIGSFAFPTAGPSRAGGTGNAALGQVQSQAQAAAADQALHELELELPSLVAGRTKRKENRDGAEQKTTERAFSFESQVDRNEHQRELAGSVG